MAIGEKRFTAEVIMAQYNNQTFNFKSIKLNIIHDHKYFIS